MTSEEEAIREAIGHACSFGAEVKEMWIGLERIEEIWGHKATQDHLDHAAKNGVHILTPEGWVCPSRNRFKRGVM